MITEWLIRFTFAAVRAVLHLVPVVPAPTLGTAGATRSLGYYVALADGYAPVVLALGAAGTVLAYRIALFVWRGIVFVYHQFWGSN